MLAKHRLHASGKAPLWLWPLRVTLVVLGAALVAFIYRGHSAQRTGHFPHVDFTRPATVVPLSPQLNTDGQTLHFAIAPVLAPAVSLSRYRRLVEEIGRRLGRPIQIVQGDSYATVNQMIRNRTCDIAFICTYAYVRAMQEAEVELLAAPVVDGRSVYHSDIIVGKGIAAEGLEDLRDTRFASADQLSCSGWLYPVTYLRRRGLDHQDFFAQHIITGSHDRSVDAVASGFADAAAVDSVVLEEMLATDPLLNDSIRTIHRSPPIGMPPIICRKDLPLETRERLREILLTMHEDEDGRSALATATIDRFTGFEPDAYREVRLMVDEWEPVR